MPSSIAVASPNSDPSMEPFPEFVVDDPARAVAVEVEFMSRTDVDLVAATVAPSRAHGREGGADVLAIELRRQNGTLIERFSSMHPLWVFDVGEDGNEHRLIRATATATLVVPFSPSLATVRLIDLGLQQTVADLDVSDVVAAYCAQNPAEEACIAATTTTTTSTTTTTTSTTTMPTPDTCGDPTTDGATTATDALFVLQAAVGIQTCELCICDVNDSGAVTASDALAVLGFAVGQSIELSCPVCSS
jgi:hypothetical protein